MLRRVRRSAGLPIPKHHRRKEQPVHPAGRGLVEFSGPTQSQTDRQCHSEVGQPRFGTWYPLFLIIFFVEIFKFIGREYCKKFDVVSEIH